MQVLLQYQSKSYYIIGQEVYYSIGRFITLSGSYYSIGRFFITLSGSYYSIGRFLLHYRAVISVSGVFYYIIGQLLEYRAFITLSVGTKALHLFWRFIGHCAKKPDKINNDGVSMESPLSRWLG